MSTNASTQAISTPATSMPQSKAVEPQTKSTAEGRIRFEALGRELIRFRWPLLFVGHAIVFTVAYWMAFCLRFDFAVPFTYLERFLVSLPFVVAMKLAVFCALRSFHGWWRHVTFRDLISLSRVLAISFAAIVIVDYFFFSFWIPRSVLIMDTICTGLLVGLTRSSWRIAREGLWPTVRLPKDGLGALMVANSHESVMLAHQINSSDQRYRIVGLLTDDLRLIGSTRAGIPVVGTPDQATLAAPRYGAAEVWVPSGGIPGSKLRAMKNQLESTNLAIKIIPPVLSSLSDNGQIPIRNIDIRDLLRRDAIELDTAELSRQLRGRRVMVTGAGGSIGAEICRQLTRFHPSEIVLVDHRENSVFLINQELESSQHKTWEGLGAGEETGTGSVYAQHPQGRQVNVPVPLTERPLSTGEETGTGSIRAQHPQGPQVNVPVPLSSPGERVRDRGQTQFHPCVGDILDEPRMRQLFETHRPEFVYHAAAHKHVGLMECNAGQAIKNNIFGTKVVADLAKEYAVQKFVLISTDKAVNPTSVMGATKQIAERYINALAQEPTDTAFVVVRFGNVLGSNGSVVPIFKRQIAAGGPITVTDERMTRFFMTIPEASQLVLQAASMGNGGEIFVLEMGEQVPILDLAKEMIRLAGLPENAIEIQVVGSRPGEKLYEELYFDEEQMLDTEHPKIQAAYHRNYSVDEVRAALDALKPFIGSSNGEVRARLKELIPEFTWNPGGAVAQPATPSSNGAEQAEEVPPLSGC